MKKNYEFMDYRGSNYHVEIVEEYHIPLREKSKKLLDKLSAAFPKIQMGSVK